MENLFQPKKGEYRDCRKCWFETSEDIFNCPKCSIELHSESKIRNAGSVDVGFGWILAIMLTGTFFLLLLVFAFGKYSGNVKTRENFSTFEVNFGFTLIFGFVLGLLGFAVTMIRAGHYAIKHGRRDRTRIKKALILLVGSLIVGQLITILIN